MVSIICFPTNFVSDGNKPISCNQTTISTIYNQSIYVVVPQCVCLSAVGFQITGLTGETAAAHEQ